MSAKKSNPRVAMATGEKEEKLAAQKVLTPAQQKDFEGKFGFFVLTSIVFTALGYGLPTHPVLDVASRLVAAASFAGAGIGHFDRSLNDFYLVMMPPFLPAPEFLHRLAGLLEALSAAGLLMVWVSPAAANASAWLLVLTLWGVYPANLYIVASNRVRMRTGTSLQMALVRLPIQFLFLAWIHLFTTEGLKDTFAGLF